MEGQKTLGAEVTKERKGCPRAHALDSALWTTDSKSSQGVLCSNGRHMRRTGETMLASTVCQGQICPLPSGRRGKGEPCSLFAIPPSPSHLPPSETKDLLHAGLQKGSWGAFTGPSHPSGERAGTLHCHIYRNS